MKTYLITFRSITLAQRAQKAMEQEGLPCRLRRTPRWMEQRGCGYAVEVKLTGLDRAVEILGREGISYRKAYVLTQDGSVEEAMV